jgi:2-isopropylmalate synthase
VVSDQSGANNVAAKLTELGLPLPDRGLRQRLVSRLKGLEEEGWAFEDADASFELLARRELGPDSPPFAVLDSLVVASGGGQARERKVQASVKVEVRGVVVHTAAEGLGPVAALDSALRRALVPHFPELAQVELVDYRVRVIDGDRGTGATVRVGVDSSDGRRRWTTVGCSANILEASCEALIDSYEWAARHPRMRAPQSSTA